MRRAWAILLFLALAGCVSIPADKPTPAVAPAEVLLNENALKEVQEGMTATQVHEIMGQELVIGYTFVSGSYRPLTVPNPYKLETIKAGGYMIEYYIDAIRRPDGIVSDDELMPLVFKDGKLIGRGWPLVNSLRGPSPAP